MSSYGSSKSSGSISEGSGSSSGRSDSSSDGPTALASLAFIIFGDPTSISHEDVVFYGAVGSGVLTGVCTKGALTLAWSGTQWTIAFDAVTPASGNGAQPNYEPLAGFANDVADPTGGAYMETGGPPFPNWMGSVTLL